MSDADIDDTAEADEPNGKNGVNKSNGANGNGTLIERSTYVESPIIMSTVRVIAPFVLTYGLFIMFHGADSSGGGFQGGVIISTVLLMFGIAFGIDTTRDWVNPAAVVVVVGIGVLAFLGIGFATLLKGGAFLEYNAFEFYHASKYSIEFVELAIGVIVAGVITGLFFTIDAGGEGGENE